jgi:hypothetical protein
LYGRGLGEETHTQYVFRESQKRTVFKGDTSIFVLFLNN